MSISRRDLSGSASISKQHGLMGIENCDTAWGHQLPTVGMPIVMNTSKFLVHILILISCTLVFLIPSVNLDYFLIKTFGTYFHNLYLKLGPIWVPMLPWNFPTER